MRFFLFFVLITTSASALAQSAIDHQKAAKSSLDAELSREGHDCPGVKTTLEENGCIVGIWEQTQKSLNSFFSALTDLLPASDAHKLAEAQKAWLSYRELSCNAIDNFYVGGTIRLSVATRCRIELSRSRMRDLDDLYNTVLHH
ncbi:MAG TPA: lysozyme inhibitor LprI family protein [Terriglobales bacterium]|nr:lysozyme inhibitor LprI family protein [Terriglobales bacterium]